MLVCDVPMQQPATSCSSNSHIAIRPHTGSNNDQCFSCSLTLYQCSLHRGTLFCTPVENTSWFGAGKKRQLTRGWGKHHFLC